MKNKLSKLKQSALLELAEIKTLDAFNILEIKYLGRKGELSQILRKISDLKSIEEKKEIGQLSNTIKKELQNNFQNKKENLEKSNSKSCSIDVTLPGQKLKKGHLHPITLLQNELNNIFASLGFMTIKGPELESDYYNFEALNFKENHPARDMQDTFCIDQKNKNGEHDLVMRTQVTSIQVRAMRKYGAPIRAIMPGRVFRNEDIDASHEHTFYQMDGFMVGEDISIANMIAVMREALNQIFKKEVKTRIRPGFFPFVEPGIEIDMECLICDGNGCCVCKQSGWLEILPGGLIHPNVLKSGGIDSKKYNGLAFDIGITRLAMMRYGINDIRLFQSGDLKFLEQF